jgi:hypothetical protein
MNADATPYVDRGVVVGVFGDRAAAGRAVAELRRLGVPPDGIGVISRDSGAASSAEGSQWEIGAATGAVAGGATGTVLGFAVAAGLLPGIGPVVAGGLLAGVCASAAAGALAGGLLGALIGLGIPEHEAAFYHGQFQAGRTLVTIRAGEMAATCRSILRWHGASDAFLQPQTGKPAETEMTEVGGDHIRTEAARRMNERVEAVSSPHMPPGVSSAEW